MVSKRGRQAAATYLLLFFLAATAAPHHHINDLEDLLFDQRSDSGILVQMIGAPGSAGAPSWNPFALVRDISCLACFLGDYVCAPANCAIFVAFLSPLSALRKLPARFSPDLFLIRSSSRAPPSFS